MTFTGTEDQEITLSQGSAMTLAYRTAHPSTDTIKAEYFGKSILETILNQTGCVGIRVYNGLGSDGKQSNVLVGVDANGNDMVNGVLGDRSVKSPPFSGSANSLNS